MLVGRDAFQFQRVAFFKRRQAAFFVLCVALLVFHVLAVEFEKTVESDDGSGCVQHDFAVAVGDVHGNLVKHG